MRALGVLAILCGAAHAQPAGTPPVSEAPAAEAPPTSAQIAFREGRDLLEAGKHAEACAKFEASFKEDPDAPGTMLNLGLCNDKLGLTATALRWFRKAQFRSAETGMTTYEDAAKKQTIQLATRVPTLRIEKAPAGSRVTLDGSAVSEVELARVEVDPGPHVIEAGPVRKQITIKEGEKQTIDLSLPVPKRFVTIGRGITQRRNAYLLAGGGAVLYAGTLTLSLIGKSKYDGSEHAATWERWQRIVRYGGTSMFLAGSAAIAAGVYLYVRAPGEERIEVAPAVGHDALGVAVHGAF